MANKTLRSLAKDYAQGKISQENYRKIRSGLIDDILSGKIIVEPIDFPPPLDLDDGDPTVESGITQINPEQFSKPATPKPAATKVDPPTHKETHYNWIIGCGVVAVICLVVLILLFVGDNNSNAPDQSSITVKLPENTVSTSSDSAPQLKVDKLVNEFLSKKDWSTESRQSFITNWQNLSIQEQTTGLNSVAIARLSNAIYQKLNEERALLGLGDNATVIAKQRSLVNFANLIGINDSRLVVEGSIEPDTDVDAKEESTVKPTPVLEAEPEEPQTQVLENLPELAQMQAEELVEPLVEKVPESSVETSNTTEVVIKKKSISNTNACNIELIKSRKPYCRDVIADVGNGPTMVVIPGGNFMMGGDKLSEQPVHEVTIHYPFALSVSEITIGEFQLFCEDTQRSCPEQPWVGKDYPVVNVSWHDTQDYLDWLSDKTGSEYRLPSEAEWEYSARAGTSTKFPFGDEILITDAVFSDQKQLTSPLPKTDYSINRNNFRLYHMMGNVREWVADNWQENYASASNDGTIFDNGGELRVVRGGSYNDSSDALRSGARFKLKSDTKDIYTGFRILQIIN